MTYRVLRRLAAGGFSDILEVEDRESALTERLVLKRLNAEMSAKPAVRDAFAEEARILRDLKHPNVVTFRRCYIDPDERVCLVMEKVDGEALDLWASRHAASPSAVLDLFERILAAVDYLHERAVPYLHLDLKPENILVTRVDGVNHPVLIDFGIARRSGGDGLKAYTPPYGAPEQVAGKTLSSATDVYALGQILDELLDLVSASGGSVPAALREVSQRARYPARRRRYADAGGLRLALRSARRSVDEDRRPSTVDRLRGAWKGLSAARRKIVASGIAVVTMVATLWLAVPADRGAGPPAEISERERFDQLVTEGRRATYQRRFGQAETLYDEARAVFVTLPDEGRYMERELSSLRSQIDIVREGGPEGERVRLDLH